MSGFFCISQYVDNERGDPERGQNSLILIWIASLSLAMTHSLSSRGEAVAIQIEVKKGMYIVLDCFAIARNDGMISTAPQSRSARQLP